jgi:rfaE bifunctional protein nucleotidyltransferase chain/domain
MATLVSRITDKILTLAQADAWVEKQRAEGQRIGFTCGAFDVVHAGHAQYLNDARSLCDKLLVAVNSDESIRRYKDPLRPINPWAERAYVVAALASCDRVTALEEDRPLTLIERWKPELYIKGGDYGTQFLRSSSAVEAYGGQTVVIPTQFGASTTAMYERIQALAAVASPVPAIEIETRGLALLDLDGTLIRDASFDPTQVEVLPGVVEALGTLQSAGFRLCVITNQQGIGLGYFGYRDFVEKCRKLLRALGAAGISIAKIYFCPHSLADQCDCRKPAAGLILRALREQRAAIERCVVIGDSAQDMEAAREAGCRGLYVGPENAAYATLTIGEAARQAADSARRFSQIAT